MLKMKTKGITKYSRNDEFDKIPSYSDYKSFVKKNYKLLHLKQICKFYKLKRTGNKEELYERIYIFFKKSYSAYLIQKTWYIHLYNKYKSLKGPALLNRSLCVNETDFYTMDMLKEISDVQIFSFYENTTLYGCDILSLYLLIKNNEDNNIKNPYTRNNISNEVIYRMNELIRISYILCKNIKLHIDNEINITDEQLFKQKVITLFQTIDNLGNYTDPNWLLAISNNKEQIIIFLRELADIWCYRANLSYIIKQQICPQNGNPFSQCDIDFLGLCNYNINILKKKLILLIDIFINNGIDTASRCLGANYILCALTLVSNDAANCLPWLYQSVQHYEN